MPHILLLTAAPGTQALRGVLLDEIQNVVEAAELRRLKERWLAPGEAWEASFDISGAPDALKADIIAQLRNQPIDVHLITDPGAERRKKLLIADMDSTIIEQECIDEIAYFAGFKQRVADITERAMRGELEFDSAVRERVGLLKGLNDDILLHVLDERLTLMAGARTLVQTMRANGAFCALVSGGFTFFTSRIAEKVGFHVNQANRLGISDGYLDGTVHDPILGREAKLAALEQYAGERGLSLGQTLAVGDGANDLAMIKAADAAGGLGVAYRAKPVVAAEATASITHGDLTALLYLQGYSRDEFVKG